MAFETVFGWVLASEVDSTKVYQNSIASHQVSIESGVDIFCKFWEVKHQLHTESNLSPDISNPSVVIIHPSLSRTVAHSERGEESDYNHTKEEIVMHMGRSQILLLN